MIAEDYFPSVATTGQDSRRTLHRSNRNLNSIVSTIRDDGPSFPGEDEPQVDEALITANVDEAITHDQYAPVIDSHQDKVKAFPGKAVIRKVVFSIALALLLGTVALLVIGKYPVADKKGLHFSALPQEWVVDPVAVKAIVQETLAQWVEQVGLLISGSDSQVLADSLVATAPVYAGGEIEMTQILAQLDVLADRLTALEAQAESRQQDVAVASVTQQVQQGLQVQALQVQLDGLQQQVKGLVTTGKQEGRVSATRRTVQQQPGAGAWVVNVASGLQQKLVEDLQKKLQKKEIETELKLVTGKNGARYRLRVVGFGTSGEAKRYADKLVQKHGIKGAWASAR